MSNPSIFVQISYALGAGLIVFGIPAFMMTAITYYFMNKLENKK